MLDAFGSDNHGSDARPVEHPSECIFGKWDSGLRGFAVEAAEFGEHFRGEPFGGEMCPAGHAASGWYFAVEIVVGEQSLRERRIGNETYAAFTAE